MRLDPNSYTFESKFNRYRLAVVKDKKTGKYGVMDMDRNIVVPMLFDNGYINRYGTIRLEKNKHPYDIQSYKNKVLPFHLSREIIRLLLE